MSYATDISPIIIDVETVGLPDAADYLEPVQAAKNLKDPEKIAADIASRTAERNDKLALDWNVGRIGALGWWVDGRTEIRCNEENGAEAIALQEFWEQARHRCIVGFNVKGFDLRFMIQRSRYLGVTHPTLDLGKYSKQGIRDLFLDLTFNDGTYDQGAMRRTLKQFCKRFGIPVVDDFDGKDMPALIAAGDWAAVSSHLTSDLGLTVALARKLGVLQPEAVGAL